MMRRGLLTVALGALVFTLAAYPFVEFLEVGQFRRAMLALALGGLGLLLSSWSAGRLPVKIQPWGYGAAQLLAVGMLAGATAMMVETLSIGQFRRAIASLGGALLGLMVLAYNTSRLAQAKELSLRHLVLDATLLVALLGSAALFSEFFFLGQFRRAILVASGLLAVLGVFAALVGSRVGRGTVWVPTAAYLLVLLGCLASVPLFWGFLSAGQFRRALLTLAIGGTCAVVATYWMTTVEPEGEWWGW